MTPNRPTLSIALLLIAIITCSPISSQSRKRHSSRTAGVSQERLAEIDRVIAASLARSDMPGAVVLANHRDKTIYEKAFGLRTVQPVSERMTTDTIFDMASLTKVVATTTSVMILVERGKIRLSEPIGTYIPELKGNGRERVTVELLMTHRAGYAPDFNLSQQWSSYDEAMARLYREPLRSVPGSTFVYSDIGFIALGELVHRVSGQTLDAFAEQNIFKPLGMVDTGFRPPESKRNRIAPTEKVSGASSYLGGNGSSPGGDRWLRGEVHDPTSFRMGGVAGHAGLFSTARDMSNFCEMLINGGAYMGHRILSPAAVATMLRPRVVSDTGATRALGWDLASSFSSNRGELFPFGSYGHTGFTGTSAWIDPSSRTFVIFLSNRVHPNGKGDVGLVRNQVASIVASAITDTPVESIQDFERNYDAETTLDLLKRQRLENQRSSSRVSQIPNADVLTGVDVLEKDGFKELDGMRVGLVTNHTGKDRKGEATLDILYQASNLKLVALFSPEHGIRGEFDERVSDSKDEKTGLPIYSLYGERRRPSDEQLKGLDALVFDIQDIGSRFYTYTSTLGNVMQAAAAAKIPLFVLDRPNPINAVDVEGPVADEDRLSFTAFDRIPVRHGLTIGELGMLFNAQRSIGCDLRVVKMQNYSRSMWFDSTNLRWINPSPNMRNLTEATLYPGIGLLETTNVSVGRGTDTPFELIGAPWIDGVKLATYLNEKNIRGVRFVPVAFTPSASVFKGEVCNGVNIVLTNRDEFEPVTAGIEIAAALHKLFGDKWKVDDYIRLLANNAVLSQIKADAAPDAIVRSWQPELDRFKIARAKALLY